MDTKTDNKPVVKVTDPVIPACKYCKQLIAEPCTTAMEYIQCNNEDISFNVPDDFDSQLN